MIVLPADSYEKLKNEIANYDNLNSLDKLMHKILLNPKLNSYQKWNLYRQQLIKYANIKRQQTHDNVTQTVSQQNNNNNNFMKSEMEHSIKKDDNDDYATDEDGDDEVFESEKSIHEDNNHYFGNYNDRSGYFYDHHDVDSTPIQRLSAQEFNDSFPAFDGSKFGRTSNINNLGVLTEEEVERILGESSLNGDSSIHKTDFPVATPISSPGVIVGKDLSAKKMLPPSSSLSVVAKKGKWQPPTRVLPARRGVPNRINSDSVGEAARRSIKKPKTTVPTSTTQKGKGRLQWEHI